MKEMRKLLLQNSYIFLYKGLIPEINPNAVFMCRYPCNGILFDRIR